MESASNCSGDGAGAGSGLSVLPNTTQQSDIPVATLFRNIFDTAQAIDPSLLDARAYQSAQPLSCSWSPGTEEHNMESRPSINEQPQTSLANTSTNNLPASNDFDVEFGVVERQHNLADISHDAIPYLVVWISQNKARLPSLQHQKALEILTRTPKETLMPWLRANIPSLPVQGSLGDEAPCDASDLGQYRARCLDSKVRYRERNESLPEARMFECTNRCGRAFRRKGDWTRHERLNFEQWKCPTCSEALSRRHHLLKHLKKIHNKEDVLPRIQAYNLLEAKERPCGFCSLTFDDWSAWLSHVGAHFEGSLPGGVAHMSQWREQRRPHAQQEKPASGADHDAFGDTFNFNSAVNGYGGFSPSSESPSGTWDDSADFSTMPFETYARVPKESMPPPPGSVEQHFVSAPMHGLKVIKEEEDDDDDMVPAMAILNINGRPGIDLVSENGTKSSNASCGCASCVRQLQASQPAVQMLPGATSQAPHRMAGRIRYSMERYLGQDPRLDHWSTFTARCRYPQLVGVRSKL